MYIAAALRADVLNLGIAAVEQGRPVVVIVVLVHFFSLLGFIAFYLPVVGLFLFSQDKFLDSCE